MRPSTPTLARRASVLAIAGLTLAVGAAPLLVSGADHLDAPAAKADHRIDITDIYAFRSGSSSTTLVLNVDGLLSPADSETAAFRTNALYELKVDTTGDAVADIAYRVRFGSAWTNPDGTRTQAYVVRRAQGSSASKNQWSGAILARGLTTPYGAGARTTGLWGGGSAFAGTRDDPFFFDLPGFVAFKQRLLEGSTDLGSLLGGFTGSDTFAATNVLSIALKVPNAAIGGTGRAIGVWATTSVLSGDTWVQKDRMARPAINTVFNGLALPLDAAANDAEKDAFNSSRPTTDRTTTKGNVTAVLNAIGKVLTANGATAYTPAQVDAIANVLLPDVLTLTVGNGAGFLNGRQLADDVIDAELSLLTNGAVTSDGVNANDAAFSSSFPYLASPH
jgi:hypothetical protein